MVLRLVTARDSSAKTKSRSGADRRSAVEALFLQHKVSLLRYLLRLTTSPDDALDLLQECYVRLLRQTGGDTDLTRGYLFTVALNLARDRRRRAVSRSESSHQPVDTMDLVDPMFTPDDELLWRQGVERVQVALQELPSRRRKIFLLRRFRNMSTQQIADLLNVSKRTVERELEATMEYCRDRIKDLLL